MINNEEIKTVNIIPPQPEKEKKKRRKWSKKKKVGNDLGRFNTSRNANITC